ncbi:RDD family protein [Gloeocapsa sp. PCC 73106]|uniref:RDD family protein n=1 Tax=Gloeocapsa sp. PCC 73106 TaxID=102232 RepID=UPI0002AD187B|nr:RDD family protein [Gloeocapsa sp. PCC 73106]ELR98378.1 putative membrane protein [Gloeocapsa sp. PCC 73106]
MGLFNRVNLETPESVELEFNLAGIGNRAYALCLDYLVLGIVVIVVLVVWAFAYIYILDFLPELGKWLLAVQILMVFFFYTSYFVFFETLWQGQTPGKRWTKIRVISDDGTEVSLTQSLLRALLRPIDDLFFIGSFLIVFSKSEKRLGDLVAGTLVVKEENSKTNLQIAIAPETQQLAEIIQQRTEVSQLLPEEFATIREYLQRRRDLTSVARNSIGYKLADRVMKLLGLETIPNQATPELFLEAVYLAYQRTWE